MGEFRKLFVKNTYSKYEHFYLENIFLKENYICYLTRCSE